MNPITVNLEDFDESVRHDMVLILEKLGKKRGLTPSVVFREKKESRTITCIGFCPKINPDKMYAWNNNNRLVQYTESQKHVVSLDEAVKLLTTNTPEIKINGDVVEFKDNGSIKVGCTIISRDTIEEIYKVVTAKEA